MDFVALDFETATSSRNSICSVGLCVVENNVVVETKEILVRPEPFEFNKYNIYIHHITPDMVIAEPTFDKLWDEIRPYLENKLVIAHNASFDVNALLATLDAYSIEYPSFDYLCTVKLSQKAYPELESHKLNCLGEALGIDFSHHHACDDAYACAMVLLHILSDFNLENLAELVDHFEIEVGKVYPGYVIPCKKRKKKKSSEQHMSVL